MDISAHAQAEALDRWRDIDQNCLESAPVAQTSARDKRGEVIGRQLWGGGHTIARTMTCTVIARQAGLHCGGQSLKPS
jgi:hypothetical protein